MKKMWAGRTSGKTDQIADDFNSSIRFDQRMYPEDIAGSIAHAKMLAKQGIIPEEASAKIIAGLEGILADLNSGKLEIDPVAEDIHMFIEETLTDRIGQDGKMLHTARSRNDQVALDIRLYMREENGQIKQLLKDLVAALCDQAEKYKASLMPGYTHLQRAQPVTFAHWCLAYVEMLARDESRLQDALKRLDVSPLGCGVQHVWQSLLAGKSGITRLSEQLVADIPCKVAGQVPSIESDPLHGFDPLATIPARERKKMDRFIEFTLVAAREALTQAGWSPASPAEQDRTATVIATGKVAGCHRRAEKRSIFPCAQTRTLSRRQVEARPTSRFPTRSTRVARRELACPHTSN